MSKVKDKPEYEPNYPDPVEFEDELDANAVDIIHGIHTYLVGVQDTKPNPEDIMFELARRIAMLELKESYDSMEKFLNPRKRARPKLDKAQTEADKLWSGKKKNVSVREMARILAERGFGSKEHLRKNLKKPS